MTGGAGRMLEETGDEDAVEFGVRMQHLTRERRGRELVKRLLLYDIQGQSVQHSLRAQQHMPNGAHQQGAHQQADVRVNVRPLGQVVPALVFSERRSSTSGNRPSSYAASSIPIGCRQNESS